MACSKETTCLYLLCLKISNGTIFFPKWKGNKQILSRQCGLAEAACSCVRSGLLEGPVHTTLQILKNELSFCCVCTSRPHSNLNSNDNFFYFVFVLVKNAFQSSDFKNFNFVWTGNLNFPETMTKQHLKFFFFYSCLLLHSSLKQGVLKLFGFRGERIPGTPA